MREGLDVYSVYIFAASIFFWFHKVVLFHFNFPSVKTLYRYVLHFIFLVLVNPNLLVSILALVLITFQSIFSWAAFILIHFS